MTLDPAVLRTVTAMLAILLLVGAWQKLRDLGSFRAALEGYELLPAALLPVAALALPLAEAATGLLLVVDATRVLGAWVAVALLAVVTAAVAVNLLRGRTDVGCGCGGIEDEQTISWALVARNLVLMALAALGGQPAAPRALHAFDLLTIAAGACAAYGLYAMVNQLLANRPRLLRLRTR